MRIGVLSDTHARTLEDLPRTLVDDLTGMDFIVHAGDYTSKNLLDGLLKLGEFKGVYGNMDPPEVRSELRAVEVIELKGFKIGVTHPSEGGSPFRLEKRIRKKFKQVDVIIYGHTHRVKNETQENILYFNPGSVVGSFAARSKSYGILEIGKEIEAQIIRL